MDIENLLPIAIGVLYLASRFLKERRKQKQQASPTRPRQVGQATSKQQKPPKKTFTFEDILKEFDKNFAGEQYEEEKPLPIEEISYEKSRQADVRQKSEPSPYKSYEGAQHEVAKGLSSDSNKQEQFSRSKNYEVTEEKDNEFMKMLREPNGAKNAIVLSEIMNRKYF